MRFHSLNYLKPNPNKGFSVCLSTIFSWKEFSEVEEQVCLSYSPWLWPIFMCLEMLWTFFPLSICLSRYGMLNLCDLCNVLISIWRKTLLYFSARRKFSRQILSLWTSRVLDLQRQRQFTSSLVFLVFITFETLSNHCKLCSQLTFCFNDGTKCWAGYARLRTPFTP